MRLLARVQPRHWVRRALAKANFVKPAEVCFFVPEKSRGWILEAACREIAQWLDCATTFCGDYKAIPDADAYYFCHYHFYLSAVRINPWLRAKNCIVWFTHPKEEDFGDTKTIAVLNTARIVTMCSRWRNLLIQKGVRPDRVVTIVGAADPDLFRAHERGEGKVGFCTAYYERKRPDRILEIVQQLPEYEFILMGRNWDQYRRADELFSLPNLEYREANYEEYPQFYSELDVFVSTAVLEGGPIPLLESMMTNVIPVASDTGFAPDVVEHGENGFLYPADERDCSVIADLIRQAKVLRGDIRSSVLRYSWEQYAEQHARLFLPGDAIRRAA